MTRITLVFPDAGSLWAFSKTLRSDYIQINSTEKKITCHCSDAEITNAMMQYGAEIIDEVEERKQA